jgi:hypothetical protein
MRMVTLKSSWSNEPLASLQLRKAIDSPMSAAAGMVLTEMNTPMSRPSRRRAQADENADGIHSAQGKEGRRT